MSQVPDVVGRLGRARRGAGKPSSTDVARRAGVSQKTVSRVMNGEPLVSHELRSRVLRAAGELGYRPNSAARALVAGRTYRLGYVSLGTTLHGPVTTLVAAERAARLRGYSMTIVTTSAEPSAIVAGVDAVREQGAEGVVISEPLDGGPVGLALDVPVLTFGRFPGLTAPHVITILQGSGASATLATEHLLEAGHHTVHHVSGPDTYHPARERLDGWRRALEAADAEVPPHLTGDWTAASGHAAGLVLAADPDVTAVFCANDDMAIGLLCAMREAGRDVPGEVSVIGFDDVPLAPFAVPSLSTVRHPFEAGSSAGIAALVAAIENPHEPTPQIAEPPGRLVVRESSAGPRRPRRRGGGPPS